MYSALHSWPLSDSARMRVSLLTAASQALKQALTHAGVLESAVGRRKWKVCCKTEVSELCRVM